MTRLLPVLMLCAMLSAPARSADTELHSLMRRAFPEWKPGQPPTITVPGPDTKPARVAVTPRLVVHLDARHRALIVSGILLDENDQLQVSHAAAGNLGAYVFLLRNGRWVKALDMPSIGWTGFFGDIGKLRAVSLGAGSAGLAVENGSCWQGFCGEWLTLYAVSARGSWEALQIMTRSHSVNSTTECRDWLDGRLGSVPENYNADLCSDIAGLWRLETPPGRDQGDVIVDFKGLEAAVDTRTGAPTVTPVRETLILRRQGERYEIISGRNPTHRF